jgi:hypothetical protein
MPCATTELSSLAELRDFIEQTICDQQLLVPGSFECREKVLVRRGRPCGMHFTLWGPRSVQFSAIWDAGRQTVLFYDSSGERFERRELKSAEPLREQLAAVRF